VAGSRNSIRAIARAVSADARGPSAHAHARGTSDAEAYADRAAVCCANARGVCSDGRPRAGSYARNCADGVASSSRVSTLCTCGGADGAVSSSRSAGSTYTPNFAS
jgi:hypothetical protein